MNILKKNIYILIYVAVFSLFFSVITVYADIFKYVDENGVMHFTNAPTSSRYHVFIKDKSFGSFFTTNKYDHYIALASEVHGVAFPLLKAIIKAESNFNPRAVSKKGAQGLMQLMPDTAKSLNVYHPFDPWENIMGGTKYFKMLLTRFNGKLKLALAGYNAGPNKVEQHNGIPPYKETENYVKKVLRYYYRLRKSQPHS